VSISILIVDDEEPFRRLLKKELGRKGFATDTAGDGKVALDKVMASPYDVVLLDIDMPGTDGMTVLRKLRNDPASPAVIVLTGKATVDTAVEAMKVGAVDYLTKPYKLDELALVIRRAHEQRKLSLENRLLQRELTRRELPDHIIAESSSFREMIALADKIAPTGSTVLITGESGTGKEIIARYIWEKSDRSKRAFIALNCSTLSGELMESELFGHEKGAFTSAVSVKNGLVETANGGTLFLDEIGEMPVGIQAKLLRFLDSGEFRRVGGNRAMKADVRIIAATNRNLDDAIKKGDFREDLYYRLNVITINIPPLRDRKDDVIPLAEHFMAKYSRIISKRVDRLDRDAAKLLVRYNWPGNVRELENVIERAVILCDSGTIMNKDLSIKYPEAPMVSVGPSTLKEVEKEHILNVLKQTGGNQTMASKILGVDRKTLYLKLKKYGIS
jgi:DNA-binding NtrC family response regulator